MFGRPISGKGRFIPAHMQRWNIQVTYALFSVFTFLARKLITRDFYLFIENLKKEPFSYFFYF